MKKMVCCHHPQEESVAQCSVCGEELCRTCACLYDTPVCGSCAARGLHELHRQLRTLTVLGFVFAFAYAALLFSQPGAPFFYTLLCAIGFGCTPFGWSWLNEKLPRTLLVLPILGWIIYFVIKFFGSILIGWLCCIWKFYQAYTITNKVKTLEQCRSSHGASGAQPGSSVTCGSCGYFYTDAPTVTQPCPECGSTLKRYHY